MAYLAAFDWGWLLASLLLGLAMGWIAVVHRGPGHLHRDNAVARTAGGGTGRPPHLPAWFRAVPAIGSTSAS